MLNIQTEKLKEILKEPYQFKKDIGLNPQIPIGIETEFTKGNFDNIFKRVNSFSYYKDKYNKKWITKYDGFNNEVVSPVFYNQEKHWQILHNITEILESCHAKVSENDSLQVSFGLEIFQNRKEVLNRFLKIWRIYEPEIYRFSYGKKEKARLMLYYRALPIRYRIDDYFQEQCQNTKKKATFQESFQNLGSFIPYQKNYAINVRDIRNTQTNFPERFEIRTANATINFYEIQNTIQFFAHLVESCQDDSKDWEFIDQKYESEEKFAYDRASLKEDYCNSFTRGDYPECYKKITDAPPRLEEAIELGNFIYPEEDYFKHAYLKQYIKSEKSLSKMK